MTIGALGSGPTAPSAAPRSVRSAPDPTICSRIRERIVRTDADAIGAVGAGRRQASRPSQTGLSVTNSTSLSTLPFGERIVK